MKIHIESVQANGSGALEIVFSSTAGRGRGIWSKGVPTTGRSYDVELDVNEPVKIGINATLSDSEQCSISTREEKVVLCGNVESVDDDGMVYLRLSTDCIIMLESEPEAVQPGRWLMLGIPVGSLELAPQGS